MNTSIEPLDAITIKMLIWKPSTARTIAIAIVKKVLKPPCTIWPDELDHNAIAASDRNAIGISYRLLMSAEIIEQTGAFRKSNAPGRNSGFIFQYQLKNRNRAETFLRRNRHTDFIPAQETFLFN